MLNKVTNNNYRIRRNAQQSYKQQLQNTKKCSTKLQTTTTEYEEMLKVSKLQTITTEYEEMLNKVTNNNYRIRRNAQSK